jgi:hypothetical protein
MVAVAKIKKSKSFLQTFDEMRNENRGEEFLSKHDITLMEVLELKRQLKWKEKEKITLRADMAQIEAAAAKKPKRNFVGSFKPYQETAGQKK